MNKYFGKLICVALVSYTQASKNAQHNEDKTIFDSTNITSITVLSNTITQNNTIII